LGRGRRNPTIQRLHGLLDAKPIPGTRKVVASFSPEHGLREHNGHVTVVDPAAGPDATAFARRVSQTADFRDPYPLAEDSYLVAQQSSILLMNGQGATRVLHTLTAAEQAAGLECHEPRPLSPRPREPLSPHRIEHTGNRSGIGRPAREGGTIRGGSGIVFLIGQFALNTSAFGNVVGNLWLAGPEGGYPYLNVGNGGPKRVDGSGAEAGGTKLYLAGNWGPRSPAGGTNDWIGHGVNTWDYYELNHDG
jgi:hypothetical protein